MQFSDPKLHIEHGDNIVAVIEVYAPTGELMGNLFSYDYSTNKDPNNELNRWEAEPALLKELKAWKIVDASVIHGSLKYCKRVILYPEQYV